MKLDLSIKKIFEGKFCTENPRQKVEPLKEFHIQPKTFFGSILGVSETNNSSGIKEREKKFAQKFPFMFR